MRSTSGQYYPGLDHLRALAAFLVFGWHFTHGGPVPYGEGLSADFLVLAPFDEGHCGVALFMTLSGYLFAKLLDGKRVHYANFVWSRFIRLGPLLIVIFVANGILIALHHTHRIDVISGLSLGEYIKDLLKGLIMPTWPNGGWSTTVEMHFYLLLPMILWLRRQWRQSMVCVLIGSVILRAVL
jgi:peptidoglycan/LPS O-acetylase OafA/YrhL